jgi:excisionase family DNA binding protein
MINVELKLHIEFNGERHVFSLNEFKESVLEAIRRVVRQELDREPLSHPAENRKTSGREFGPALAVSKAEAAQILGVSVRTIDRGIALKRIGVTRLGRRVLIPMKTLETVMRHGTVETHIRS